MMTSVIETLLGANWVSTTLVAVLGAGVRGVLLLGGVLAVAAGLRAASAATRHAWVGAGLIVLLMLPLGGLMPWRIPLLPAGIMGGTSAIETSVPDVGGASDLAQALAGTRFAPADRIPVIGRSPAESGQVGQVATSEGDGTGTSALTGLLAVWLLVMAVLAGRMIVGHWRAWRVVRRAEPVTSPEWTTLLWESADRLDIAGDVRLLQSPEVEIAFATGVFSPAVVVPRSGEAWSEDRRRAVLMHELAHVRRRDLLLHHASRWACLLYWFNPFVWMAARRLRAESERAADDLVLQVGTRPSEYADHLLQIVAGARIVEMPAAVLPLARRREFEGRILAILEPHLRRTEPSRLQAGVLTATIALLALPLAALTPAAAAEADDPLDVAVEAAVSEASVPTQATAPERSSEWIDRSTEWIDRSTRERWRAPREIEPVSDPEPLTLDLGPLAGSVQNGSGLMQLNLDASTRKVVIRALADADEDPRAVAALIELLRNDPEPEVRVAAARGLGELEAPEAVEALSTALINDAHPGVRTAAAWALGEIEDELGVDALVAAMVDESPEVRRSAIHALSDIESFASVSGLTLALSDPDPNVRRTAARTLGDIDLEVAPPELIAALTDESAEVRVSAAHAIGEIEDPSAATALGAALSDVVDEVRAAAIQALVELESPEAIDALIRALQDESATVRRTAAKALGDL
ncbi:MAG: hypothetical protein GEU90_17200 [Gemmatimonas sp.]|nr:hypothetical protein [Gemmatimonas sp.]